MLLGVGWGMLPVITIPETLHFRLSYYTNQIQQ